MRDRVDKMLYSWDCETLSDLEQCITVTKDRIEDFTRRGTFSRVKEEEDDLEQLLQTQKDIETIQRQCDNQETNIVSTNDSIGPSDDIDCGPRNMVDQICNLLKNEGFTSVEALESNIAELRQKLNTAITKKQEMQINRLTQKLASRERLQEEITGRSPFAYKYPCMLLASFAHSSHICYLNVSTDA